MREFKRKLSVIMILAMILTLFPGPGAREIAARAAETLEGPVGVGNLSPDGDVYRETGNGLYFSASFGTATAANAYRDLANTHPEEVIKVEIEGDPEGVSVDYWGDETAWNDRDEDGNYKQTELIIGYGLMLGEQVPDSLTVTTTLLGCEEPQVSEFQVKDIPAGGKIKVAKSRKVEVGKCIQIPIETEDAEQILFLGWDWSEAEMEPSEQKTSFNLWRTGSKQLNLEVCGMKPGTATFDFWIEGSEEETRTTLTITVEPRTITLDQSEVEIDMDNDNHEISIDDIGMEDFFRNGELKRVDGKDDRIICYEQIAQPEWKVENEKIASLEDSRGGDDYAIFRKRIVPHSAGTTTITVEWLGAKASLTLTVAGLSLQEEINEIIDGYRENVPDNEPLPVDDIKEIVSEIAEKIAGKALTKDVWNALNRLNGEYGRYLEAYGYNLYESDTTLGLVENVDYFAGDMTLPARMPEENDQRNSFFVTLGDAAEADVSAVSGTNKTGFTIHFAEGKNEEETTPIETLRIPIRVTLAIPDDLADVEEEDLVVYYVGGAAARSASGTATELPAGYVVKSGSSLLLQIDQPGTYVLAQRVKPKTADEIVPAAVEYVWNESGAEPVRPDNWAEAMGVKVTFEDAEEAEIWKAAAKEAPEKYVKVTVEGQDSTSVLGIEVAPETLYKGEPSAFKENEVYVRFVALIRETTGKDKVGVTTAISGKSVKKELAVAETSESEYGITKVTIPATLSAEAGDTKVLEYTTDGQIPAGAYVAMWTLGNDHDKYGVLGYDSDIMEMLRTKEGIELHFKKAGTVKFYLVVDGISSNECTVTVTEKKILSGGSVSGGSTSTSSSRTVVYTPGWIQNETGWWYRNADGTWPANTWAQLDYNGRTDWYHFDANGYMQTGWFTDTDGRVYYLNPVSDGWKGSMFVGSHVIDGKTYYFNETSDGHKGALVQ